MDHNVNFCKRIFFSISKFINFISLIIYRQFSLVYFSCSFTVSLLNNVYRRKVFVNLERLG